MKTIFLHSIKIELLKEKQQNRNLYALPEKIVTIINIRI